MYSLKENRKLTIINVGPSFSEKGGIVSVISSLKNNKNFSNNNNILYLETYTQQKIIQNFLVLYYFLLTLIFNRKVSIIHIHSSKRGSFFRKSLFILVATIFRKKVILHIHSGDFHKFASKNLIIKTYVQFILLFTDKIICLSKFMENNLIGVYKSISNKTIVIPNGVENCLGGQFQKNEKPHILFMGKIIEAKGVFDFIDAINLCEFSKDERITIAGDADQENLIKLLNKISESKHKDKIFYAGWINEVEKKEMLKHTKILVLPSYSEGHPITILEAMSNRIPIIATNIPPILECVPQDYPYLFTPKCVSDLAKQLCDLKDNTTECERKGEELYNFYEKEYTLDVQIERIQKIYRDLSEKGD